VEALSSNRAARIAQSDQSRVSTAAFRARVEFVEGGDRQMQQCPLVHPEGVTGRPQPLVEGERFRFTAQPPFKLARRVLAVARSYR